MQVRRQNVLALVSALEPIVQRISELTIEIRHALDAHPDGSTFRSLFIAADSWLCAATMIAEIDDCRSATPTTGRWQPTAAKPRSRSSPASQTRPVPLGLRPHRLSCR